MRFIIFLLSWLLGTTTLLAQTEIRGRIIDANGNPQAFANVILYFAPDSSFVNGTITDDEGLFMLTNELRGAESDDQSNDSLANKVAGLHFIKSNLLGSGEYSGAPFTIVAEDKQLALGDLTLQSSTQELETITVTAQQPLFVRQIDRTVVNLENRPSLAGNSVLDVIERLPGLIVNRQNNTISILGKDGVNIMINGRIQYLTIDALFSYLQGMNADNVKSIEIITTPPANLDAEGNAGYLNIVLKQVPGNGLRGSYNLAAGYGRGETATAGFNLDYRKDRFALLANFSGVHSGQQQFTSLLRQVGDQRTTLDFDRFPSLQVFNLRLGVDYQLSDRTILGIGGAGNLRNWEMTSENNAFFSPDTTLIGLTQEDNLWQNLQSNFNLSHQLSTTGKLSFDLDYLLFKNDNPVFYTFDYRLENDALTTQDFSLNSEKETPFNILVAQLNYEAKTIEGGKFSAGIKGVRSRFENTVIVERDGQLLADFSGFSELREDVAAAYLQYERAVSDKVNLKGGLRYEFTDSELSSATEGVLNKRSFGSFFPSLYARLGKFNLSYARRINRPEFSAMAPFLLFLDPRTNFSGNPNLQPSIINAFEASVQLGTVSVSAQYAIEDSSLVAFQNRYDPITNTQIITPDNLRSRQLASLNIGSPIPLGERWRARIFALLLWQQTETIDDDNLLRESVTGLRLNGSIAYDFGNGLNAEVSGFYQGPNLNGNVRLRSNGILNAGLVKSFDNGSNLGFNVSDALETFVVRSETTVALEDFFVARDFDFSNRTFRFTYSKSFGGKDVKGARKRSGAEEAGRVN